MTGDFDGPEEGPCEQASDDGGADGEERDGSSPGARLWVQADGHGEPGLGKRAERRRGRRGSTDEGGTERAAMTHGHERKRKKLGAHASAYLGTRAQVIAPVVCRAARSVAGGSSLMKSRMHPKKTKPRLGVLIFGTNPRGQVGRTYTEDGRPSSSMLGRCASRPLARASKWPPGRRRYGQLEPSQDTIYAPATGSGRAAVQIIRIAGSRALEVYDRLTSRPSSSAEQRQRPPPHRLAQLRRIRHPKTDETLDHHALSLFFPSTSSACGDPTLELHLHGSPAVLRSVLSALSSLDASSPHPTGRVRPAEPGEFTRRAFLNGRMDLTEVEGLRDLIEAETEGQRTMALRMAEVRPTLSTARPSPQSRSAQHVALHPGSVKPGPLAKGL